MSITTWLDGCVQTVPDDDPRIAEQERAKAIWRHVLNMRHLDRPSRREYLVNVARKEGTDAEQALREAFLADWARRQKV